MKKIHRFLLIQALLLTTFSFAQTTVTPPPEWQRAEQNQKRLEKKQTIDSLRQDSMASVQSIAAKQQKVMMSSVKAELIKDQLLNESGSGEVIIDSKDMFINGRKQSQAVHDKYILMINSLRGKSFGDKERWQIQQ